MLVEYLDIIDRAGEPDWYDQNGVPRYGDRNPEKVTVYGQQVVFYVIACQECGEKFVVAEDFYPFRDRLHRPDMPDLAERVREGSLHYGDPPIHWEGCAAGNTMNCDDVRVLEFWEKKSFGDWQRRPELEVDIDTEGFWERALNKQQEAPDEH